jgi:hypothetical protein
MNRFYKLVQFLPLTIFVLISRIYGTTDDVWSMAFQIGAVAACLQILIFIVSKKSLNRILLGTNLFLILGGVGFYFRFKPILNIYGTMREATIFCSLLLVGIVSTLFTQRGYIDTDKLLDNKVTIKKSSIFLLAITAVSLVISVLMRGNIWLSGTLPFIFILVAKSLLVKKMAKSVYK